MTAILLAPALLASSVTGTAQWPGQAGPPAVRWVVPITGPPLVLLSPLETVPAVREAVRLILPQPNGHAPALAVIPFEDGGGPITLLAPWGKGWLVGTNTGEWGGALYISEPGGRTMLAKGNVVGGFSWHGSLYVLSGLRHLMSDVGEIWEVDLRARRLVRRTPLPAQPDEVVVTRAEGIIIRTRQGDVALLPTGKIVRVADRQPGTGAVTRRREPPAR